MHLNIWRHVSELLQTSREPRASTRQALRADSADTRIVPGCYDNWVPPLAGSIHLQEHDWRDGVGIWGEKELCVCVRAWDYLFKGQCRGMAVQGWTSRVVL